MSMEFDIENQNRMSAENISKNKHKIFDESVFVTDKSFTISKKPIFVSNRADKFILESHHNLKTTNVCSEADISLNSSKECAKLNIYSIIEQFDDTINKTQSFLRIDVIVIMPMVQNQTDIYEANYPEPLEIGNCDVVPIKIQLLSDYNINTMYTNTPIFDINPELTVLEMIIMLKYYSFNMWLNKNIWHLEYLKWLETETGSIENNLSNLELDNTRTDFNKNLYKRAVETRNYLQKMVCYNTKSSLRDGTKLIGGQCYGRLIKCDTDGSIDTYYSLGDTAPFENSQRRLHEFRSPLRITMRFYELIEDIFATDRRPWFSLNCNRLIRLKKSGELLQDEIFINKLHFNSDVFVYPSIEF